MAYIISDMRNSLPEQVGVNKANIEYLREQIEKLGFTPQGDYKNNVQYEQNDAIVFEGSAYVHTGEAATIGISPADEGGADVWTKVLTGTQGPAGPAGPTGPQGPKGPTGPQGPEGPEGPTGPQGEKGEKGNTGATGPQGERGEQGIQGPRGPQGPAGATGATGATGPEGPTGPTGPQGPKGDPGEKGADGASFIVVGTVETTAELPDTAPAGTAYFVGATAPRPVYVYDEPRGAWVNQGPLQGPQGVKGDQGEQGAQGPAGPTGPQGPEGPTGPQGPEGPEGPTGPQGEKGEKGNTGATGPQGERGEQGIQGPRGPQGPAGATGATGPQGPQGEKGEKGETGATGPQGPAGPQGEPGAPANPLVIYPVGSIYMSVNSANPGTFFGGTWVAFGAGRALVGVDTTQTEFNTVEKTGGAKTHTLTVEEMPSHNHGYTTGSPTPGTNYTQATSGIIRQTLRTQDTGGGQAHNNLQPYITVYMWKRTA